MKARYDSAHIQVEMNEGSMAYLKLHDRYKIPGLSNKKLALQRGGPFRILSRVGKLAYKLQLPPTMRIWPVVSVAQLEPATGPDPYNRVRDDEPPPVDEADADTESKNGKDKDNDKGKPYEVEKLLDKKTVDKQPFYLVK